MIHHRDAEAQRFQMRKTGSEEWILNREIRGTREAADEVTRLQISFGISALKVSRVVFHVRIFRVVRGLHAAPPSLRLCASAVPLKCFQPALIKMVPRNG